MARKGQSPEPAGGENRRQKRGRVSQADVPRHTLAEAMRVPEVISEEFAKRPTKPFYVADALGVSPTSSRFRTVTGAAVAYGLTNGAYNASEISLTELGRRAVSPTKEDAALLAKREALMRPRVIAEFLARYSDNQLPREQIARNVLGELGVAPDATDRTLGFILKNARDLGLIQEVKGGRLWVDLKAVPTGPESEGPNLEGIEQEQRGREAIAEVTPNGDKAKLGPPEAGVAKPLRQNRRVFITHGKDRAVLAQLKDILSFGDFEPVVSVETQSTAKPVPDKVLDEMRSCSAAIIHVGAERRLLDQEGKEHRSINENVLVEIGAAMALYGRRFILLVQEGVQMPSNLQGLYEVRYEGETLDSPATMRLLKAFNEFKEEA